MKKLSTLSNQQLEFSENSDYIDEHVSELLESLDCEDNEKAIELREVFKRKTSSSKGPSRFSRLRDKAKKTVSSVSNATNKVVRTLTTSSDHIGKAAD